MPTRENSRIRPPSTLATAGSLPSDDDDELWAYEFKWDGVRALARIEGGRIRLFSRVGNDITASYPELRVLGEELGSTECWLDGEIVAFADGKPSFSALQKRMHVADDRIARRLATEIPVTYIVFDVLHLDGKPCVSLTYDKRRELLDGLDLRGTHWNTSPSFAGDGPAVLETAREQSLEGVVAKRLTSRYFPGRRSGEWLKITDLRAMEVIIGGWTPGEGRRSSVFGSLMLGVPTAAGLHYVGQVGTGFTDAMLDTITAKLTALERKTSPFHNE
ncbi:MAG TPA: non-homologous end-joining DNA ligase, partial [Actinokineospora sp.]|nr:non-homologous end-joining DNA ligase [Actinokineospora sp.]